MRRGFRLIIEDEPDLKVVGEAGEGSEAVEMAERLKPNVVVMDYSLPGANGLVVTLDGRAWGYESLKGQ